MRFEVIDQFNPISQVVKTVILYLDTTDDQPICAICGKTLEDNTFCYFISENIKFNCLSCIRDSKIDGVPTGDNIPLIMDRYDLMSCAIIKLVRE
jgi:hypothetical protein